MNKFYFHSIFYTPDDNENKNLNVFYITLFNLSFSLHNFTMDSPIGHNSIGVGDTPFLIESLALISI